MIIQKFLKAGYSLATVAQLGGCTIKDIRHLRKEPYDELGDLNVSLINAWSAILEEKKKEQELDMKFKAEQRARQLYRRIMIKSRKYNKFTE